MREQESRQQNTQQAGRNNGDLIRPEQFREIVNDAREHMEVLLSQKNVRYYRARLKADKLIYAYEGDKQVLLTMLGDQAAAFGFEILAFSLLDDELQILMCRNPAWTGSGKQEGYAQNQAGFLKALQDDYSSYYQSKRGTAAGESLREEIGWKRVKKGEILSHCQEIHELPVKEHYVTCAKDFWWSSQNSYIGKYSWRFLNIWRIMGSLSGDPAEAVRMYRSCQNS